MKVPSTGKSEKEKLLPPWRRKGEERRVTATGHPPIRRGKDARKGREGGWEK